MKELSNRGPDDGARLESFDTTRCRISLRLRRRFLILVNSSLHSPSLCQFEQLTFKMSKTVQIASPGQFSDLLKSSRIVVTDCESTPPTPPLFRLHLVVCAVVESELWTVLLTPK
jgi:hypothetical protein